MVVRNLSQGQVLATDARWADTFWQRLRGLMLRRALRPGEGLLIRPCQAVHTHFMRFSIDVIFVDPDGRVLQVLGGLRPWRFSPRITAARTVVELSAGAAGRTALGDLLAFED